MKTRGPLFKMVKNFKKEPRNQVQGHSEPGDPVPLRRSHALEAHPATLETSGVLLSM